MGVEAVIRASGIRTCFGDYCVHEGLDLEVTRGEVLGIVGGSGTGKSVLMRHLILLTTPTAGRIEVLGEDTAGLSQAQADVLRQRMGVMFQQGALFSSLTVGENVAVPLREHTDLDSDVIEDLARLKVSLAGLSADAADKYPRELSGGMLKRAAVARALALDPELLFLDEPSAGLDPVSAHALDELIVQLKDSLRLTVVLVSHDLDSLWHVTDRVAFLGEKKVLGLASMEQLSRSTHPLIAGYFQGPRGRSAQERAWVPR